MTDRKDPQEGKRGRRQAEGVRIIGAEEAQKALDAGQAAGRRSDDELRFGDVPPAPSGPRPSHRFPLPDSVDPAEAVPRPPVAPLKQEPTVVRPGRVAGGAPRSHPDAGAQAPREGQAEGPTDAARSGPDEPHGIGEVREGHRDPDDVGAAAEPPTAATEGVGTPSVAEDIGDPGVLDTPVARPDPAAPPPGAGPVAPAPAPSVPTPPAPAPSAGRRPTPTVTRPIAGAAAAELAARAAGETPPSAADRPLPPPATPERAVLDPAAPAPTDRPLSEAWTSEPTASETWTSEPRASEPPAPGPTDGPHALDPTGQIDVPAADAHQRAPTGLRWASDPAEPLPGSGAEGERATAWRPPPGEAPTPSWAAPAEPGPAGSMHLPEGEAPYDSPHMAPEPSDADPTIAVSTRSPSAAEPPAPEDRITVTGSHELPHWTAPAGGDRPGSHEGDEELEAWDALGGGGAPGGARWRNEHDDWHDAGAVGDLTGEGDALGALDSYRDDDPSGMYSFDEDFERLEEERSGSHPALPYDELEEDALLDQPTASGATRIATRARGATKSRPGASRRPPSGREPGSGRRLPGSGRGAAPEMSSRVGVGVGFAVVLVVCYAIGAKALLVLAAAVVLACAVEAYGILRRSGFRPATMLGLVATVGFVFAAYWRGDAALPLVAALTFAATMVWYLLGIVDARPLANVAVTSMTVLWVGLFGSYAALMLRTHDGRGLFFGAVAVTAIADVVAFLAGRSIGNRPLAPDISPGKTVEGLLAGAVAAIIVGIIVGKVISPWGGIKHGILLGIVVAVVAPIGDLFESLIKRDLSVKDSGSSLGGHGGLLDRFDSLLLVLPAAYYLADALHLIR